MGRLVPLLLALSLSMGASSVLLFYFYWRERLTSRREDEADSPRVLFFPDVDTAKKTGAYEDLSRVVSSAEKSICVCVYAFSSWRLIDILISAHQKGVVVRVITDREQMASNASQVERLRSNGIQVRHNNNTYFMHHKFAIIDDKYLVNGSLNWTRQGIHGNQENVVISSNTRIVVPFMERFEHLWKLYHPQNYCSSDLNDI